MTKIKLCGIRSISDATIVSRLMPEYAGFIFYEKSKRYVSPAEALKLRESLEGSISTVGVFVNASEEAIMSVVSSGVIDMIQLHGTESDEFIENIREKSKLPVIKAFGVSGKEDIKRAELSKADYILLDNKVGGSGESFNHELLRGIKREYFLAGGLNPETIEDVLNKVHPFAVDVSSGIESTGVKDYMRAEKFVNNVRKLYR